MASDVFSVYQVYATGRYERLLLCAPLSEAMSVALALCAIIRPDAHHSDASSFIQTLRNRTDVPESAERVIVVDGGDCIVWDWTRDCGIVFPPTRGIVH